MASRRILSIPGLKVRRRLYTKEFFQLEKDHLKPGGVVTQFVQFYESNSDAVKSEIATFFEVFPNGAIFANTVRGTGYDVVLVGQADPIKIDIDKMQAKLDSPEYAVDGQVTQGNWIVFRGGSSCNLCGPPVGSSAMAERRHDHARQRHAAAVSGRHEPESVSGERHLSGHGEVRSVTCPRKCSPAAMSTYSFWNSAISSGNESLTFQSEQ